jgi:hypothetical protein
LRKSTGAVATSTRTAPDVGRVAKDLGVDEDLTHELTLGLEPENGVIWVYGADDDDGTPAFADEGVEEVQLLLDQCNRITRSKA